MRNCQLRAYYMQVNRAQGLHCSAYCGTPLWTRHPKGLRSTCLLAGPGAILASGLHDDQLVGGRERETGKADGHLALTSPSEHRWGADKPSPPLPART